MLKIFNDLSPFFEDCYLEVGVREYAKVIKTSPPTASKILKEYGKQGILKSRGERNILLFNINRESLLLKVLARAYWQFRLKSLIDFLRHELMASSIVLFGSTSKLETQRNSDFDIIVISSFKKTPSLKKFEKELGRNIQLFNFKSFDKINSNLRTAALNGHILWGVLE